MTFQEEVNQWFESGDYPTSTQFRSMHTKLRWKDEFLSMADIEGLIDVLNALARPDDLVVCENDEVINYLIPATYKLVGIIVIPIASRPAFGIHFTEGDSGVILPDTELGGPEPFGLSIFAAFAHKTIALTGLDVGDKIVFEKRKINF